MQSALNFDYSKGSPIEVDCLEYADGFYDVDYTAIPAAWASEVRVIQAQFVSRNAAENLAESFLVSKNQVMRSSEPREIRVRQAHLLSHKRRFL